MSLVGPEQSVIRVLLERLGVIGEDLVPLPQRGVGPSSFAVGVTMPRLRRNRPAEVLDGQGVLALLGVDTAAPVRRLGVARLQDQGHVEVVKGLLPLPEAGA